MTTTPNGDDEKRIEQASPTPAQPPESNPQFVIDYRRPASQPDALWKLPDDVARASLILALLSFPILCFFGVSALAAVLAVLLGFKALGRIRRGLAGGETLALIGLTLGFLNLALAICIGVVFVYS